MSSESEPPMKLDPKETAFIFIEYQNEFTTEGGKLYDAVKDCMAATGTLKNSKKVLESAREKGALVVHCPIMFEKGHHEIAKDAYGILDAVKGGEAFLAGTWNSEICDEMKPVDSDMVIKGKTGLCSFHSSNLEFILRQNNVKNVVMGGFLTNCCVESSMRSAYERGYKVFTLKDCCAATNIDGQNAAFEHTFGMFSVPTTSDEVISGLN